jgi:hypothetical protein
MDQNATSSKFAGRLTPRGAGPKRGARFATGTAGGIGSKNRAGIAGLASGTARSVSKTLRRSPRPMKSFPNWPLGWSRRFSSESE